MKKVSSVEAYIEAHNHFEEALRILRALINTTPLEESLKWNAPVYSLNGKNVVGLGAFKNHFSIWFFNGVFLKDEKGLLEQAQEKTKALRQMRFKTVKDIDKQVVLAYVNEAIKNQTLGKTLKVEKKGATLTIPALLKNTFKAVPALNIHFKALAPYKQREYCEYLETAKRAATKQSRLEKIIPMIQQEIGLHDKYRP